MPNPTTSPEASSIESAYQDEVKALFKALFMNLAGEPSGHGSEHVERFKAGFTLAKRARDLALNAIGADVPATVTATRSKKSKKG